MRDRFPDNGTGDAETRRALGRLGQLAGTLGTRLASLEFRNLVEELDDPAVFDLGAAFPDRMRRPPESLPPADADLLIHDLTGFAPLEAPLGRIAWSSRAENLPTLGIHCPDLPSAELSALLLQLLTELHREPFARLVFLTENCLPYHVLTRYGFAVHVLPAVPLAEAMPALALRFGIDEVRGLADATPLWTA